MRSGTLFVLLLCLLASIQLIAGGAPAKHTK